MELNEDKEKDNIVFGLRGNGLNNKIIEEKEYPDGIVRGNKDYKEYVKIAKEMEIEEECI